MSLGRLGLVQAGQPSKKCPTLAEMTADATATAGLPILWLERRRMHGERS